MISIPAVSIVPPYGLGSVAPTTLTVLIFTLARPDAGATVSLNTDVSVPTSVNVFKLAQPCGSSIVANGGAPGPQVSKPKSCAFTEFADNTITDTASNSFLIVFKD